MRVKSPVVAGAPGAGCGKVRDDVYSGLRIQPLLVSGMIAPPPINRIGELKPRSRPAPSASPNVI